MYKIIISIIILNKIWNINVYRKLQYYINMNIQ